MAQREPHILVFAFSGLSLWQNLWTAVRSQKGFCAQLVEAFEAWAYLEGGVNFWKGSGVKKKGTFLSSGLDTRPRVVSGVSHEALPRAIWLLQLCWQICVMLVIL